MAHGHHANHLTLLKTPWGYLTETGFTEDINSKDIVVLRSNTFGKWSTMKERIGFFLRFATLTEDVSKKLYSNEYECETIAYPCNHGNFCDGCRCRSYCQFWNGSRDQLKFSKLYTI